jgi:transcriptional regulator with XRE-family HTH domain
MAGARRAKAIPTIYDVASRAGVSIASVSRVLNGQGSPRAETRKKVLRAVRALSFVPDGAARALSNNLKRLSRSSSGVAARWHSRTRRRACCSSTSSTAA